MEVKIITLKDFLKKEFPFCFVCGRDFFIEFEIEGYFYRVCKECLEKEKVKNFFKEYWDFDVAVLIN